MTQYDVDMLEHLVNRIAHDLSASARVFVEIPNWIEEDLSDAEIELPSEIQNYLDALKINGIRLNRMIHDLTVYVRAGKYTEINTISAAQLVAAVMQKITLPDHIDFHTELPNDPITVAQSDVSYICAALISNAIKHRDDQTTQIELKILTTQNTLKIIVIDDGPGILPKYREKAKEIFSTLKSRDEVEGSGMGLAIVQRIVEINHGKMRLSGTKNNRGLIVIIELPIPRMEHKWNKCKTLSEN